MNTSQTASLCLLMCLTGCVSTMPGKISTASTELFNGRNLDGWYVYLDGPPRNTDPGKVFQVHDQMIHVYRNAPDGKPQPFGYLATESEYQNYRLEVEFKWGRKKFPPRADKPRDAGILYHFTGPDLVWPTCVEFQIQGHDLGDIYTVDTKVTSSVNPAHIAKDAPNQWEGSQFLPAASGGIEHSQGGDWIARVRRSADYEQPGWNQLELIVRGDAATYVVNGHTNNQCWNLRRLDPRLPGEWVSLNKGKIILQAEGAEVFYRNVRLTHLE